MTIISIILMDLKHQQSSRNASINTDPNSKIITTNDCKYSASVYTAFLYNIKLSWRAPGVRGKTNTK
jgi:hypothetical protein